MTKKVAPKPAQTRPTKKQKEILNYIDSFIADKGYSPSYREIMAGCGYSSVATVATHIDNLIGRGHLVKTEHHARTLELVKPILSSPMQPEAAAQLPAQAADAIGEKPVNESAVSETQVEAAQDPKNWLLNEVKTKLKADETALHEAQTLINAVFILGYEKESAELQDKLDKLREAKEKS